jgi:hypothetical protein
MPVNQKLTDAMLKELRAFGLAYPGAHTKSPWPGHLDLAVNDKTFAYMSLEGEPLGLGCKLPESNVRALLLPHCEPMAYGLGKSGWVSAKFAEELPPIEMLKSWIDESYRAQAPKKLIKELDARGPRPDGATAAPSAAQARALAEADAEARAGKAAWEARTAVYAARATGGAEAAKPARTAKKSTATKPAAKPAARPVQTAKRTRSTGSPRSR